jgi:glycosyltransferase involved in cell wall biosynthesis
MHCSFITQAEHGAAVRRRRLDDVWSFRRSRTRREKLAEFFSASDINMYKLSVGAIFRNEEHGIKEWIEHYLNHGVEHFYLIDDASDDNSVSAIKQYIETGIITLFSANWDRYIGRQRGMYNHYILPHLQETEWLLIVDLDEFMYSPRSKNLTDILNLVTNLGQIQVEHTIFGSNGHITQPSSIIANFTRRSKEQPTKSPGNFKYFVNSKFQFTSLNIHHATFVREFFSVAKKLSSHFFRTAKKLSS